MALATTTLAGACGAMDNTINVTSATGFAAGSYCLVDAELMKIQAVNGTAISVFRGVRGTQSVAHTLYALVEVGTAAEFAAVASGGADTPFSVKPRIYTYAIAGAISILPGIHRIGAGAAEIKAMTLADPAYSEDGLKLTIISASAYAHTITSASSFSSKGSSFDVATCGGAVGDCMELVALGGKWHVLNLTYVTLG